MSKGGYSYERGRDRTGKIDTRTRLSQIGYCSSMELVNSKAVKVARVGRAAPHHLNPMEAAIARVAQAKVAQAKAAVDGRDFVTPDDVKALAAPVLGHRLILNSTARLRGSTPEEIIGELLSTVPVPIER